MGISELISELMTGLRVAPKKQKGHKLGAANEWVGEALHAHIAAVCACACVCACVRVCMCV